MTYIIAGLGNPGLLYRKTRHNAGFSGVDRLAERNDIRFNKKGFSAVYGEGQIGGQRVILVKPQTYMNNSGDAVQQILHFYKLPPEQLIVLYDDIDLPVGSLRIRANGSAGTHNGMRSIVTCIGSDKFARVRIGVGNDQTVLLRDYVLKRPSKDEQTVLAESFDHAAEAVELIVAGRINDAQGRFNKKHEGPKPRQED